MHLNKVSAALVERVHGGPDACGSAQFDFSTNSNACGPCPSAVAAVSQADATRYPDTSYTQLQAQLAQFHGVDAARVLLAGSASEFIFRITAWVAGQGGQLVSLPPHSYGDYAQAAAAWGLTLTQQPDVADLIWACEPSSPLGGAHAHWPHWLVETVPPESILPASVCPAPVEGAASDKPFDKLRASGIWSTPLVLDCAYAPLRLSGAASLKDEQRAQVWQLWTPNKALGLTGVRAAYVIAPLGAEGDVAALERLAPSWVVGAHGVAMLQAWVQADVQAWLAQSLPTLREWKARQIGLLASLGWTCLPSETNFFCARPSSRAGIAQVLAGGAGLLADLRLHGIKLRDTTSFGLPSHVRLSVLAPAAQDALAAALAC